MVDEVFAFIIGFLGNRIIVKCPWCVVVNTNTKDGWNTCVKCFKDYNVYIDENSEIPLIK